MVWFKGKDTGRTPHALARLQHLQAEIFRQLQLLIPDGVAREDAFRSDIGASPRLHLEVLERHPYTHFIRLTYVFKREAPDRVAPDAHIRLYHDARLAEVTAFNAEQGFKRSAHPWYPHRPLADRQLRENAALDKWLGYLLGQGHSFETMRPSTTRLPLANTTPAAVVVG